MDWGMDGCTDWWMDEMEHIQKQAHPPMVIPLPTVFMVPKLRELLYYSCDFF